MILHQPKGGMCANCLLRLDNCSHLDFPNMPIYRKDKECIVHICTNFKHKGLTNKKSDV